MEMLSLKRIKNNYLHNSYNKEGAYLAPSFFVTLCSFLEHCQM